MEAGLGQVGWSCRFFLPAQPGVVDREADVVAGTPAGTTGLANQQGASRHVDGVVGMRAPVSDPYDHPGYISPERNPVGADQPGDLGTLWASGPTRSQQRDRSGQPGHIQVHRALVDLRRSADLHHSPSSQDGDLIGDSQRLGGVVGGIDRSSAEGLPTAGDLIKDHYAQVRVEMGRWFVKQEERGVAGEGSGQADALLFAAGQLRRQPVAELNQTDLLKQDHRLRLSLVTGVTATTDRIGDSVKDIQVRPQRRALEYQANLSMLRGDPGARTCHDASGQAYLTMSGPNEAGQRMQQGRLARAGSAEKGKHLPLADL